MGRDRVFLHSPDSFKPTGLLRHPRRDMAASLTLAHLPPRSMISAVFSVASGIGVGAGQFVSGALGEAWGWRLPFVLIALPAIGNREFQRSVSRI